MTLIRTSAVAGQFHSGSAGRLGAAVAALSEGAQDRYKPGLEALLGDFSIVPIAVGDAKPELVSQTLDALWGGSETLIVISSDLSHYLKYDDARAMDTVTFQAMGNSDAIQINHEVACGATPLRGRLVAAKRRGMKVTILGLRNSTDTTGNRSLVVGYGAWVLV